MTAGDAGRLYPALDITWPEVPSDLDRELLLAVLDADLPTAVEDTTFGARVFFASGDARDRAAMRLAAERPGLSVTYADVDDEQWAERTQEALTPVRVGDIVVVPVYGTKPGVIPGDPGFLFIRPSMGFGTGHHASTRLCLALLQQTALQGASVLDVGTGSAVLAIAAAQLGAATVRAIDNDPDALQSARENVELNHVCDVVTLALSDVAAEQSGPWHLVLANLTGAHLIGAATALDVLAARPQARLILGGLQVGEAPEVTRAYERFGWLLAARADEDGWVSLLLSRTSF